MKISHFYINLLFVLFSNLVLEATFAQTYIQPLHKVTLPQAHKGTLEVDTLLLDSYGKPPENVRRFYLESRNSFSSETDRNFTHKDILESARRNDITFLGGPMLGSLSNESVIIWVRPANSESISIVVKDSDGNIAKRVENVRVTPGIDKRFLINGLTPDTNYKYSVLSNKSSVAAGSFTTAPMNDLKGKLRIAFGADFHKIGLHNPNLYREIQKREPLVMLFYGDTAVDGRKNNASMHRSDYLLRDVSLPWKKFVANIPVYATWDDWDYFTNDTNGIPKNYTSSDRELIREVWKRNWNNPVNAPNREGIYFKTRLGSVEIFMLDTRSCRENDKRRQYTSFLGKTQHEWLKKGLKESTAPFKIISSGTMWSDYVSNAKDTWGSWDTEGREELFSLIEEERIGGVLLISGDRHGARGFKIPRKSGFEFYEFEVGTLGGVPGPAAMVKNCPEQIFGYDGPTTIAFGEFNFDTSTDNPNVTFLLIRDKGEILEEHTLTLDQLTP